MLVVSDDCYRCGACITACPVPNVITNILPGKVRINEFSCIGCDQCLPVCRFGYITNDQLAVQPDTEPLRVAESQVAVTLVESPTRTKKQR